MKTRDISQFLASLGEEPTVDEVFNAIANGYGLDVAFSFLVYVLRQKRRMEEDASSDRDTSDLTTIPPEYAESSAHVVVAAALSQPAAYACIDG